MGVCVAGGVCGRGVCGGACVTGQCAWQGACIAEGCIAGGHPWMAREMVTVADNMHPTGLHSSFVSIHQLCNTRL